MQYKSVIHTLAQYFAHTLAFLVMKRSSMLFCAILFLLGGLALTPQQSLGQFIAAPPNLNFGRIICSNTVISTTVVIRNTGANTLVLSGAAISPPNSDFVLVAPTNVSAFAPLFIPANSTQGIIIAYNPLRIGAQNAALILASNALNTTTGIVSLPISSQRDSTGFQLSSTNIVWNNAAANAATTTTLTLTNTGSVPFSLPTPQFSGAFALDAMQPPTVAPGASATLTFRFFGAPAGTTTATVFNFNDDCARTTQVQAFAAVQQAPSVTGFAPSIGTIGTQVTIVGANLANATAVFFGGVQAQAFRVDSPTQITATLGQGASGAVFVSVGGNVAISAQQFRFIPPPSLLFFTPNTGGTGTPVTLIGTNFENVTQVRFGNTPARSFTIDSPTQITAFVGSGNSSEIGAITVATQLSATTSTQQFTYIPPPEILFLTPQSGAAGTVVTIVGNNLANTRSVRFGGVAAQSFVQISPTQLQATLGADGATGLVSVQTPGGSTTSTQIFTFTAPPTINFVSPTIGAQGTIINIIGNNFTNVSGVSFGGVPAQMFTVSSPTQIIATLGQGASGNITVNTASGSTTASTQFTFAATPTITFFSPTSGIAGTLVNIFGSSFNNVVGVNFGGIPARTFTVLSPTQITAIVSNQGATGNIAVITQSGAGFSANQFMFPVINSVQNSSNDTGLKLYCTPNPSADETTLHYTIPEAASVRIEVLTLLGERIIALQEGTKAAGAHSLSFSTQAVAQGVYLCRISAGSRMNTALLRILR
ncbi:MAG: T9SS C-terminal target domain-containing protein [Candidatus Kapaibacterium sp.]|nr:MAG: T9SS C-terminal target domain-containing protein [Candidatus Kapabacteria bacterium]